MTYGISYLKTLPFGIPKAGRIFEAGKWRCIMADTITTMSGQFQRTETGYEKIPKDLRIELAEDLYLTDEGVKIKKKRRK